MFAGALHRHASPSMSCHACHGHEGEVFASCVPLSAGWEEGYNGRPMQRTYDLRIESYRPLLPPAILLEELPVSDRAADTIARGRQDVARILRGDDDRLVVIVGPCSIHDPDAGLEYGRRLKALADA